MKAYRVIASSLNLRTGPGTSYPSIRTIPEGSTLEEVEAANWLFVRTNGHTGWVHRNYVEEARARQPTLRWRLAKSLDVLRGQINAHAPKRGKAFDGDIGDLSHSQRKSDHNPDAAGVVKALDVTDDPEHAASALHVAESIRLSQDPRVSYVIHRGQIFSSTVKPWQWREYAGTDPHLHHVHVSVVNEPHLYDDTRPWQLQWPPPTLST